jgi:hypothetical protein
MLHYELDELKGMTVEQAENTKKFENYTFRVLEKDGQSFSVTMDNKKNRINVVIKNDRIVEVVGIY